MRRVMQVLTCWCTSCAGRPAEAGTQPPLKKRKQEAMLAAAKPLPAPQSATVPKQAAGHVEQHPTAAHKAVVGQQEVVARKQARALQQAENFIAGFNFSDSDDGSDAGSC